MGRAAGSTRTDTLFPYTTLFRSELHQERGVADRLDIAADDDAQQPPAIEAGGGAGHADRHAEHHRCERQEQRQGKAFRQEMPGGEEVAELEGVAHPHTPLRHGRPSTPSLLIPTPTPTFDARRVGVGRTWSQASYVKEYNIGRGHG